MTQAIETGADILARAAAAGCPVVNHQIAMPREAGFYHRSASEFRDGGPIWINTLSQGFWMLTTHELVREMYHRPDIFTSDSITPQDPNPAYKMIPTNINPPDHKKYRDIIDPWFTPRVVRNREGDVRRIARRIVEEFAPTGHADVVQQFCMRLPTEVFLYWMGLPTEDHKIIVPWVETFFRGFSGEEALERGDGEQPLMWAAIGNIAGYIDDIIADRKVHPRDPEVDFFTYLAQSAIDDRPLTDEEIQGFALLLVIAGLDTTRAQLGWLLLHLATHPDDRRRVVAQPAIIPSAVEESLRLHAMIYGNGRKVGRDIDFHGVHLKAGDMVFGLNTAANRDPKLFPDPDTFVIDRQIKTQIGFAEGPHKCAGNHLARVELRIGMEEFHRLIPEYEIEPGAVLTERGLELSLHSLPLVWKTQES